MSEEHGQKGALPFNDGADMWLEFGRTPDHAFELMLRIDDALATGLDSFYVPLSRQDGEPLAWLRFDYVATIRNLPVFSANCCHVESDAPTSKDKILFPATGFPATFTGHEVRTIMDNMSGTSRWNQRSA